MSLELVAIDLDETLLRQDKTYDVQRFVNIKEALLSRGITLCIATGNSYHKVVEYFPDAIRQDIYFAVDNGNFIIKNEEKIHATPIDLTTSLDVIKEYEKLSKMYPIVSDGLTALFRRENDEVHDYFLKFNNKHEIIESFESLPLDTEIVNISIWSLNGFEYDKQVNRSIKIKFPSVDAVTSGGGWIDIMAIDGGKGSAIRYLEDTLGINTENAMAFGDSLNDLTMMKEVGYSVAMANADPDLVKVCQYQIGDNQKQSVLSVLESFITTGAMDFMEKFKRN